jgi:hypothetical protein
MRLLRVARIARLPAFQIVGLGLGLSACRSGIAGRYELDLEETKICVSKAALDNPEDAHMKDGTIKLLEATRVDMLLDEAGKMSSTTILTAEGPPTPQKRDGTWKADGKRVIIKVDGGADTLCDVDGQRLRCKKPALYKLFSNYVLLRK